MQVEKRWKGDLEENNLKEAKIGGIIEKAQKPLNRQRKPKAGKTRFLKTCTQEFKFLHRNI